MSLKANVKFATIALGVLLVAALGMSKMRTVVYEPSSSQFEGIQIVQTVHFENGALVRDLTKVISDVPGVATLEDGAGFAGIRVLPRLAYSKLHVAVQAFGSTDEPNEIVVTVFQNRQLPAVQMASVITDVNKRAKLQFSFDTRTVGAFSTFFQFYIGPGHPGKLTFNGPPNDKKVAASITITESSN